MEGVDRGWIKEGNFFKGGEFSIRSVGFTRDREWVAVLVQRPRHY